MTKKVDLPEYKIENGTYEELAVGTMSKKIITINCLCSLDY